MNLRNWLLPTAANNYKAHLLSKSALIVYSLLLLVVNILGGQLSIVKSFALIGVDEIIAAHNRIRSEAGLGELSYNPVLSKSAEEKGKQMLASDCWSHYCPPGTSPWLYFQTAGYEYSFAGENLAEGFSNSEAVMNAWMNSKTHRENILRGEYTEIGIGVLVGNYQGIANNILVVIHFGAPKPETINTQGEAISSSKNENNNSDDASNPIIISPEPGSIINDNTPLITGEYHSEVELKLGEREGRILPTGGIFSYNPGEALPDDSYSLRVRDIKDFSRATQIDFSIDTIAPDTSTIDLSIDSVIMTPAGLIESIRLNLRAPESIRSVFLNKIAATEITDKNAKIDWPESSFTPPITLQIQDLAGNLSEFELTTSQITELNEQLKSAPRVLGSEVRNDSNYFTSWQLPIQNYNIPQLIAIFLLIFIISLFLLEFIEISRLKRDHELPESHSTSPHFAPLVLLLLLILVGNLNGNI